MFTVNKGNNTEGSRNLQDVNFVKQGSFVGRRNGIIISLSKIKMNLFLHKFTRSLPNTINSFVSK